MVAPVTVCSVKYVFFIDQFFDAKIEASENYIFHFIENSVSASAEYFLFSWFRPNKSADAVFFTGENQLSHSLFTFCLCNGTKSKFNSNWYQLLYESRLCVTFDSPTANFSHVIARLAECYITFTGTSTITSSYVREYRTPNFSAT